MYIGSGVSCATLCLTLVDDVVPRVRLCLMLLNFSIWAVGIAAGLVSAICSLMLGLEMHVEIFHFEIFKNFMKFLKYFKTPF